MDQTPEKEFKARPYQIYLYEKTIEQNSILYLPTGSGKTYIAVLLVKRLSGDVQRQYTEGGKRTIFIVNTVALVVQQTAFLTRHTGLVCKGYSGDMGVDFWSKEEWRKEINTNQVLVMTAQIFLNLLTHGYISLDKINLLIFDECHRAVKDHPMRQIMQRFQDYPKEKLPRVLAMSASLLNANVPLGKIETTLRELEVTFQAKIITVESLAYVTDYATNPKEFVEYYETPHKISLLNEISAIVEYASSILKQVVLPNRMENPESSMIFKPVSKTIKLNRILSDVEEHLTDMGLYGGSESVLQHIIQLECLKRFGDEKEAIAMFDFIITQLVKIQKLLSDAMNEVQLPDTIQRFSSSKVLKLMEVLKTFYNNMENKRNFCCIIFVKRRFTAKVLYQLLSKLSSCDEDFQFLKPQYMVGYSNNPYKNARETVCIAKWNDEVLTKFRNGVANCVVATDVVDEGVDIPSCTLIVRYYAPMDFRAYIQSKGRARHSTSHFIILASSEDDYISRYRSFQQTERFLRQALHGKSDYRIKPSNNDVDALLYQYVIQPYIVKDANGTISVITEQSAISLINEYCANLVKSKFIMLTPTWVKEDVSPSAYRVLLTLPPISPLNDTIIGDVMQSVDIAKRSAALKACIKLYEIGELNDHLKPRKPEDIELHTKHLFPYYVADKDTTDGMPGTNSKKRHHELIYPEALCSAFPKPNESLYLHIIDMKPNYPRPNDNRHLVFYNLLSNSQTYGILSAKKIPEIPSFPIFMNIGDLQINIKSNNQLKSLTEMEIEQLKLFHTLVFSKILKVIKEFMIFDASNMENNFLVVPINERGQINWDIVNRYKIIASISPSENLVVKESEYDLALVTPNYRASNMYIVTQVCEYLKAESSFPTSDYNSYVHYFKERHYIEIKNPAQPMLEVKPISSKINCTKPRSIKANLSKRKRASLTEDFEEHLVPELCDRIDFPSLYWLKATTLPSILHRISQLIAAEELRVKIAHEAQLHISSLEAGKKWEPMQIVDQFSQNSESNSDTTFDESLMDEEDLEAENLLVPDTSLEVDILSQERSSYSWSKEQEPTDLDRNAQQIQLIDIEYYCQFMSGVTPEDTKNLKYQNAVKSLYITPEKVSAPVLKMLTSSNPYGPSPVDILQSLTTKVKNDVFNLERVETLGDSFLKFAISLFLYQAYPTCGEGPLTHLKGKLVGNLNLFYCSKQKNIAGRMHVEDFAPTGNFVTPAYAAHQVLQQILRAEKVSANILYEIRVPAAERFSGCISNNTTDMMQDKVLAWPSDEKVTHTGMEHFLGIQVVSDKSVSDCTEALIGTYLLHLGIKGALQILKWFEILPKSLNVDQYLYSEVENPQLGDGDVNVHIPWAQTMEERLGYKFRNRAFLLQAFTHPSYMPNRQTASYQRLEFLGDAVLDFLLTIHIYETCGNLSPGELTDLRSALVNNITFACLAVRYGLHTALLALAPKLFDLIDKFVKFQENRNYKIDDELLWVLLEEEECNMAEHVDVPKVLGDIYESVIGAIFLDSGKNLEVVWQVIYNLMKNEIDLFSKNVPKQPIRVIHETQGANPKFSLAQLVEKSSTIMITLTVTVNGKKKFFHGFGPTKKLAKCAASKQALKYLRYKN
ncbi:endoribonuclease Dicer [Nasonia vitripennis]|uniref:Dicer-2 n=1 Tax=Nasonia vitripennis TaxID=7425 RepID=A0A7M7Q6R1_NASVI|nr:endoribonuclease Dicer [Nasonia vitripennis]XP_031782800.1 endoribonuclease Dicer [Nasonia vitripennis]XP_031782801.1 endoribonuclease Dicer [Nasonia vitripennis]